METPELINYPHCKGTGADPNTRVLPPLPPDPNLPGEKRFQVTVDNCPRCGGSGRIAKGK